MSIVNQLLYIFPFWIGANESLFSFRHFLQLITARTESRRTGELSDLFNDKTQ